MNELTFKDIFHLQVRFRISYIYVKVDKGCELHMIASETFYIDRVQPHL
jgi:hypothetical protein